MRKIIFLATLYFIFFNFGKASAQPGPGIQSFVTFTASAECADSKNGKIRILIEDDISPPCTPMVFIIIPFIEIICNFLIFLRVDRINHSKNFI
jgi:hypothetical protein